MQKILTKLQQLQIFGKELSLRDVQSPCNSCQKFAFWIKKTLVSGKKLKVPKNPTGRGSKLHCKLTLVITYNLNQQKSR